MGLKKGKYIYVELGEGKYLKVRVLKSKAEDDPSRYLPLNFISKKPPLRARVVKIGELPSEVANKLKLHS